MNYYDDINERVGICTYCGKKVNSTECLIIDGEGWLELWFCDDECYDNFLKEKNEEDEI